MGSGGVGGCGGGRWWRLWWRIVDGGRCGGCCGGACVGWLWGGCRGGVFFFLSQRPHTESSTVSWAWRFGLGTTFFPSRRSFLPPIIQTFPACFFLNVLHGTQISF